MGLFSFLNKNKQESADDDGAYVSRDDDDALAAAARSKRASSAGEPGARRTRDSKTAPDPVLPEKKRARRRLVGAVALALAVAIGLPMILDSEPKPLSTDIDIRIPSKEKAPPLAMPAPSAPADALDAREEIVEPARLAETPAGDDSVPVPLEVAEVRTASARDAESKPEAKPEAKPDPRPPAKPQAKPEAKPAETGTAAAREAEAARALAILQGKPAPAKKYVVQVAALQSQEKVNELQDRLKAAGIASFTQKSGEWIRVRVGPFSKEEGEQIRAKLDKLGLSGKVQTN